MNSHTPELDIPAHAFRPDEWTEAFQRGLLKSGLNGKSVYEVGVGTGINVQHLIERCGARVVYGSDIDSRLIPLAQRNVQKLLDGRSLQFIPISGSTNLLDIQNDELRQQIRRETLGAVVACLPQAFQPADAQPGPDDAAHYYPQEYFSEMPFNSFALGLNEALLAQARERHPRTSVILNLAGRVGLSRLLEMFKSNGYRPEIVHEERIPQCPTTNLGYFVDLERLLQTAGAVSSRCEFFDETGQEIGAREAEERRRASRPVFHNIYVIKGDPVTHQYE